MSRTSNIIMILASVFVAGGATWAALPDAGNAGWVVSMIGSGIVLTVVLFNRPFQSCEEEPAEAG